MVCLLLYLVFEIVVILLILWLVALLFCYFVLRGVVCCLVWCELISFVFVEVVIVTF